MDTFETVTCNRCGGSGHYSYCEMYGTTCFSCQGKGKVYTKRGLAARAWLQALRTKPVANLAVGMLVKDASFGLERILEIREVVRYGTTETDIITNKCHHQNITAMYVVDDKETQAKQFAAALDYQATLTKLGKPRKQSARKE